MRGRKPLKATNERNRGPTDKRDKPIWFRRRRESKDERVSPRVKRGHRGATVYRGNRECRRVPRQVGIPPPPPLQKRGCKRSGIRAGSAMSAAPQNVDALDVFT